MDIQLRYPDGATRGSVEQHEWQGMILLTLSLPPKAAAPCPHCGRRRRKFWSHVVPFRVCTMSPFVIVKDIGPVYPAGLFVCYSGCELLAPEPVVAGAEAESGVGE